MTVDTGVTSDSPSTEIEAIAPAEVQTAIATPDVKAEPSPAKDVSLLDSVKAALKPKPEGSSPSKESPDAKAESKDEPPGPAEDEDRDPTDEEKARYHSKTRKQITRLLNQRNEAFDKVKALEPDAVVGRRLTDFISTAGMSSDEANLLLDVGRNMKKDPLRAWEQLKPYAMALAQMAGESLPDDLRQLVAENKLTPDLARETQRSRTERATLAARTQESDAALARRTEDANRNAHAGAVGQAISQWEAQQAQTDPDFKQKQERIGELIELEVRRSGYPTSTARAVEIAASAHKKATTELARYRPQPRAIGALDTASNGRVQPAAPKNAIEAARQGLAAMHG